MELEIEKQRTMEKIEKERLRRRKQNEMKKLVNEWKESKKLFEQCQKQQEQFNEELEKKRRYQFKCPTLPKNTYDFLVEL